MIGLLMLAGELIRGATVPGQTDSSGIAERAEISINARSSGTIINPGDDRAPLEVGCRLSVVRGPRTHDQREK